MLHRLPLALLATLTFGCAGSAATPSMPATCPEVVEAAPAPKPQPHIPAVADSVTVRLFVVAPTGSPGTSGMPEAILDEPVCADGNCEVLYAPRFVGREHSEMVLEVGDRQGPSLLSVNTRAALRGEAVDVKLSGRFVGSDGPMSVQFKGALQTGQLTHIGTFSSRGADIGPHVYAEVSPAPPNGA
ncbi:MAG: hypothetical protein AAGA54_29415 [Myxococcota bacterium]